MKKPFSLANDIISHDSIECLESLLKDAKEGKLIGIAFAAMYKRRQYITNTAGEAHRNPTFTRGMLATLNDQLAYKVAGGYDYR